MRKISKLLLLSSSLILLCGCTNNNNGPVDPKPDVPGPVEPEKPQPEDKKDFENIVFENSTVTYDGKEHTIEATNVLEGATVTYEDKGPFTNAGEYSIKVTVTKDGYNDFTKTAKLTIKKADFNVELADKTIVYDKTDHIKDIDIKSELPAGTEKTIIVKNNGNKVEQAINAGTYNYECSLKNPNYNDLTLKANLTISKATFNKESYKYESVTVPYDGADHFNDVTFAGILPDTATTTTTVTKDDVEVTEAIDSGTYKYTLKITDQNYEDIVFEATLKITTKEEQLGVVAVGDMIYFANQIDDKYLYSYNTVDGTLELVSYDVVDKFTANDANTENIFVSKAGFLSAVKTMDSTGKIQTIYTENVNEIIYGENENYYFIKNGLTDAQSGVYELTFDAEQNPLATKIYEGKAGDLTRTTGGLFFTHKHQLQYFDFTKKTVLPVIQEEKEVKVTEIAAYGHKAVVNRNKLLGDYIETIDYNGTDFVFTKITKDAGKYFNVIGDELYFSNIDKLNSTLFGAGIYKANLKNVVADFTSTKIVGSENLLSNLYVNGNDIYYYHVENKSLYHIDMSQEGNVAENLLEGFVKPEPTTLTTVPGKNIEYKGKIYYTNVYDDKSLYRYDPNNGKTVKVTANTIKDFIIVDDVLYYNEITWLVNHDLYALKLTENSVPVKLSSDDCVDLVKHGNYLYYTKYAAKAKISFDRIVLDQNNKVEVVSETPYSNVRVHNNHLYAIKNNKTFDTMVELDFANEADVTKFRAEHEFNPNIQSLKYFEIFKQGDIDVILFVKSDKLYVTTLTQKAINEVKLSDKVETLHIDPLSNTVMFVTTKGEIATFTDMQKGTYEIIYRPAMVSDGLLKKPEIMPTSLSFDGNYIYFNSDLPDSYHFYRINKTLTVDTQIIEQLD